MKVRDFEKAIEALCVDRLVIDEMKMKADSGGEVCQVNGHRDALGLLWDSNGRAYSYSTMDETEEFIESGSGRSVLGKRLQRDTAYDLKFE